MKWALVLPLALLGVAPLSAIPPKKARPAGTKVASASKPRTASASRTAHGATAAKSNGRATLTNVRYVKGRRTQAGRYVHVAPKPSYQTQPDPDRYQAIQKALADKGYFKGEANGEWNDDSTDALRRFQVDQKIDPDGKINAHTLIGLGLGPKHNGTIGNSNLVPIVQPPPEPVSAPPASDAPQDLNPPMAPAPEPSQPN